MSLYFWDQYVAVTSGSSTAIQGGVSLIPIPALVHFDGSNTEMLGLHNFTFKRANPLGIVTFGFVEGEIWVEDSPDPVITWSEQYTTITTSWTNQYSSITTIWTDCYFPYN